jgi:hypothetical protein
MRLALPFAAVVPASVARIEPEVEQPIGLPARRTLRAQWLAEGNKKAIATNSVLETSQSILL